MKTTITESELRQIVYNTIRETIENNPEMLDEGFRDFFNGIGGAAKSIGQAAGQHYQNTKANYYSAQADGKRQQIQAQIQKSQQIINKEQQKINALRQQLNGIIGKSQDATNKANDYAQQRGVNTRYANNAGVADNRTRDFYNQQQVNGQRQNAVMQAGRKRKRAQGQMAPSSNTGLAG